MTNADLPWDVKKRDDGDGRRNKYGDKKKAANNESVEFAGLNHVGMYTKILVKKPKESSKTKEKMAKMNSLRKDGVAKKKMMITMVGQASLPICGGAMLH